jgi:hypothetical protein
MIDAVRPIATRAQAGPALFAPARSCGDDVRKPLGQPQVPLRSRVLPREAALLDLGAEHPQTIEARVPVLLGVARLHSSPVIRR